MSAWEEEKHGYEATIKALMKALTDINGSLMDSLKPPIFDLNSSEIYKDFWLFIMGIESWYTLQGIPNNKEAIYGFMQSSFWVIVVVHVMVCGDL